MVEDGIFANAELSGAKTVMPFAELSVSTRPACFTALTRVDRTGLAEAAVATGAVDMPPKLPAPLLGTDEQAGPKSAIALAPEPDADDEPADDGAFELDEDGAAAAPLELDPLQAAAPRARPAVATDAARIRYRMCTPLLCVLVT
jgi:hypothetical protein